MKFPHTVRGTKGRLTYALIDCEEIGQQLWAIVTRYVDHQDYGVVLAAFAEGYEPALNTLTVMLGALEAAS